MKNYNHIDNKKDWSIILRFGVVSIILSVMSYFLNGVDHQFSAILQIFGMCIMASMVTVITSSISLYCYTKINFIKEGNNDVVGKIYLGNSLLIGMVIIGSYFVKFL